MQPGNFQIPLLNVLKIILCRCALIKVFIDHYLKHILSKMLVCHTSNAYNLVDLLHIHTLNLLYNYVYRLSWDFTEYAKCHPESTPVNQGQQ